MREMRVLMATGGSSHSEAALSFGAQMLKPCRGTTEFTIVTVAKHEIDRPRADGILAQACELVDPDEADVQAVVRVGHPAEEILHEIDEGHYDLVIVGERQHHRLVTRFFLGSTAQRVVEHAPCPVIIAKGKIRPVRRILVCDSGAQEPSLLSRFTEQLADLIHCGEEVTVLHVMSQMGAGPGVEGGQLRANAEELIQAQAPEGELLERDIHMLGQLNVHTEPKVRHGLVVDEILTEAQSGDYDLVVIGAHRGEGWRRILLDDLAHQIIVQLDRPVLVVR
jgi:nucleotide-binding universal stress UspA family protein